MGIGDTLRKANFLNKIKNISPEGLFDVYQQKLQDAHKGIENIEKELEGAKEKGDLKRVKKLEKKLKKMKMLTDKVETGIQDGMISAAGRFNYGKSDKEK